ncbi:MAG: hypothetical protein VXW87_00640 [Pseudomonadota bacterium]|nr:hypothetical protein [Pseudomonadota bacterium]
MQSKNATIKSTFTDHTKKVKKNSNTHVEKAAKLPAQPLKQKRDEQQKSFKSWVTHLYQKTHTALLATSGILTIMSYISLPIVKALKINLGPLSLFEFYFIDTLLRKKLTPNSFSGFFKHLISDAYGILYYLLMTALVTSALPGICASLAITMPNIQLISAQASILKTLYMYCAIFGASIIVSLASNKSFYEYAGLTPILCSIMFASLTNAAYSMIAQHQLAAIALYSASLLPLLYFLGTALMSDYDSTSFTFMVGVTSLGIHLLEACMMISGLSFGSKAITKAARFLSSNQLQAPLLLVTTGVAVSKCINEFSNGLFGPSPYPNSSA